MTTTPTEHDPEAGAAAPATADTESIGPSWLPTALVIAATVLAIVGSLTTWVRAQALDTDEWVAASSGLLDDDEVQQALSGYVTEVLFTQVDITNELADALPDQLAGLAGPITGALRAPATEAVEELVASPRFGQVWAEANRRAHQTLVAVLRGESTTAVSTADGTITLELRDVVVTVGEDLGVSSDALDRIPEDAGQIVLLQSDELATAQQAVSVLDAFSWFLYILVVGLFALAVVLGRGRRREVLQHVGAGLLVSGVTVLLARAIGIRTTVDIFVEDTGNQSLATAVGQISTQLLHQIGVAQVVYGILFIAFAALLGQHGWAVSSRRSMARWADSNAVIVVVAVALVAGLWWWSPGQAFNHWTTAAVLVGLVVGAVVMLVSRLRSEFPSGSSEEVAPASVPSAEAPVPSAPDAG